ncbi:MAG: hypothetical protein M1840_004292 [Geoglossum simile]|nr:MAG: hypothetical protein M1840_004292 [Geoglossum simile]
MAEVEKKVNDFLSILQDISANSQFDCNSTCHLLAGQAQYLDQFNAIKDHLSAPAEAVNKTTSFDGVDSTTSLSNLLVATAALGLAELSNHAFSDCVDQSRAKKVCAESLAALMPALYGNHLNRYDGSHKGDGELFLVFCSGKLTTVFSSMLQSKKFSQLNVLAQDPAFVSLFQTKIQSPGHILSALLSHQGGDTHSPEYSTNILYVNEYFKNAGKPYNISHEVTSKSDDPTHYTNLVHVWSDHAETVKIDGLENHVAALVGSVSHILAPQGCPDHPVEKLARTVCPEDHPNDHGIKTIGKMKQNENAAAAAYAKTLGQLFSSLWATFVPTFTTAVKAAAAKTEERTDTAEGAISNLTWTGRPAEKFITGNNGLQLFRSDKVQDMQKSRLKTQTFITGGGSILGGGGFGFGFCFAPGTQILGSDGRQVPIESITEGTTIVTSVDPLQHGSTSAENLRIPGPGKMLYGFNKEGTFFTSNHAFYVAPGLWRAIDPVAAREINPWLDVGRLQVGDRLLKAVENNYEEIEITSIESEPCKYDFLYNLHLREGLRSYHTNGYCVYMNYPEVTLSQVADILRGISKDRKHLLLRNYQELAPIFSKYEWQTVIDILDRQMNDRRYMKPAPFPVSATDVGMLPHRLSFLDLRRSWKISNSIYDFGKTITIHRGAFYIDGAQIPSRQVHFDTKRKMVVWRDGPIEGVCYFYRDFFHGSGQICEGSGAWISFALIPAQLGAHDDQGHHELVQARATKAVPLLSKRMKAMDVSVAPNIPESVAVGGIAAGVTQETAPKVGDAAPGVGDAVPEPDDEIPDVKPENVEVLQSWWMEYDTKEWTFPEKDTDEDKTPAPTGNSRDLFEIQLCVDSRSGSADMQYRIPLLDKLRDLAVEEAKSKHDMALADIPLLYEVHVITDATGRNGASIELLHADVVSSCADAFDDETGGPCLNDLTFEKIGCHDKLPFLFSRLDIFFNVDLTIGEGSIRMYNSELELTLGTRFALSAKTKDSIVIPPAPVQPVFRRMKVETGPSKMLVEKSVSFRTFSRVKDAQPTQPLNEQDLDVLRVNLKNSDIAAKAQILIYNTMKYHMDSETRELIIKEDAPKQGTLELDLPASLGTELTPSISEWIRTRYAPAYVGLQICSGVDKETRKKWQANYTEDDEKRIRYFWSGKGKDCLAACYEYTRLNELATREASLKLAPRLQIYLDNGGEKWAETYYKFVNSRSRKLSVVTATLAAAGQEDTELKKVCNLLQVLQPIPLRVENKDTPKIWSVKYCDHIFDHPLAKLAHLPYTGHGIEAGFDNEYEWLANAMKKFCEKLLSNDPGFDNDLCNNIRKDMQKIEGEMKLNQNASVQTRVDVICTQALGYNGLFAQAKSLFNAYKTANLGANTWSRAINIGKAACSTNNIQLGTVKGNISFGLVTLAMVGFQLYMLIKNWSDFKDPDKMGMIVCLVQGVAQSLTMFGSAWKVFRANSVPLRPARVAGMHALQRPIANIPLRARPQVRALVRQGVAGAVNDRAGLLGRRGAVAVDPATVQREIKMQRIYRVRGPPRAVPERSLVYSPWNRLLNGLFFVLSICLFVSIMWVLVTNFKDYGATTRNLMIAQVVFMAIGLIAEGILLHGAIEACSAAAAVCAWLGPIVVFVVIAIGIAILIWGERPKAPIEKWMDSKGIPDARKLPAVPNSKLSWKSSTSTAKAGDKVDLVVTGTAPAACNNISSITLNFLAGSADNCLFKTEMTDLFGLDGAAAGSNHWAAEWTSKESKDIEHNLHLISTAQGAATKEFALTWEIVTKHKNNQTMSFEANKTVKYTLSGTVAKAGSYTLAVKELWTNEKGELTDTVEADMNLTKT